MSLLRLCCLALFLAVGGPACAQSRVPLVNFVDIPVSTPSTPARVKAAIVRSALILWWDVVEEADGSLTVSKNKVDDYSFKFKVSYDAKRYSLTYLDSSGLRFRAGSPADLAPDDRENWKAIFKDTPEQKFGVETGAMVHSFYETTLLQLLSGIRRHLNAPT